MSSILPAGLQEKLRDIIDEYTSGGTDRKIPGLVYLTFRNDGQPIFQHCSGTRGMSSQDLMSTDTIFYLASFTKVATSVSCMQLVERGLLHLDDADEVERVCPELRDVKVLTRTVNGGFELVEKKRRITLRMLLNHTGKYPRSRFLRVERVNSRQLGLDTPLRTTSWQNILVQLVQMIFQEKQ